MVQAVQTSAVFLNHFWGNLILRLVVCVLGGFMQYADLIYHYMAMASMAMKKKCARLSASQPVNVINFLLL